MTKYTFEHDRTMNPTISLIIQPGLSGPQYVDILDVTYLTMDRMIRQRHV